jgi:hypothetical protein
MAIEKKPFRLYDETGKKRKDVISIWLNEDERAKLETMKKIIEQDKDGTAIKQTFEIAYAYLIGDEKTKALLAVLFKNKRNNKRQGIITYDPLG